MKRWICLLCVFVLLITAPVVSAAAPKFEFELSVDGKTEKTVGTGDIVTVTFTLENRGGSYTMYGMQNEIRYDTSFFRLVPGSVMVGQGICWTDLGMTDGIHRELYMNYVSTSPWQQKTTVGRFQLQVIAQSGSSRITCEDYLVSNREGTGNLDAGCQNVTITVGKQSYTVSFQSNGGSKVPDQILDGSGRVKKPPMPSRPGYRFDGWYEDAAFSNPWNFETERVHGDLTLYAKWTKLPFSGGGGQRPGGGGGQRPGGGGGQRPGGGSGQRPGGQQPGQKPGIPVDAVPATTEPTLAITESTEPMVTVPVLPTLPTETAGEQTNTGGSGWILPVFCSCVLLLLLLLLLLMQKKVTFDTAGGQEIDSQRVFRGGHVQRPEEPVKSGAVFAGWYRDPQCTVRWNFETDKVTENTTLYAKWL